MKFIFWTPIKALEILWLATRYNITLQEFRSFIKIYFIKLFKLICIKLAICINNLQFWIPNRLPLFHFWRCDLSIRDFIPHIFSSLRNYISDPLLILIEQITTMFKNIHILILFECIHESTCIVVSFAWCYVYRIM